MKARIKNYMSLTKKEWNGITVLLVLITLVLAAPYIYQSLRKDNTINPNEFNAAIAQLNNANKANVKTGASNKAGTGKAAPFKTNIVVELNSADSAGLTRVVGIGPSFAKRIIYYRERLGGFVNKEQLKEVYGLDELKYNEIKDQLKVNPSRIRKVNINTITFDKLRLMPYLNYKQVNAIIEYRKQHGEYTNISDLQNIAIIDDGILRKIEPYLSFK
ncbi:hypothetical protein FFF34_001315 [Inquilinus sp. KBS0705]|nr:hypothetical protein FFF34_001315 [Inquilinus sp. KBS0705]